MGVTKEVNPNPRQLLFLKAKSRYVAYGGARGGGKSWAVRCKARLMAIKHGGIRILILRRTLPELRENHIIPMVELLDGEAIYRDMDKSFTFANGSRIKFGYCDAELDVEQYQGQEYDVIFMDEATHFTEYQFKTIATCLRGTNNFPKRFYVTCNPGGVGHAWVKRLFIDRQYEGMENPEEYSFIPAKVYDNIVLMKMDPDYVKRLEALPEDQRRAWLDGDWDVLAGRYFTEFLTDVHTVDPYPIPPHWNKVSALDYGLDMLAALWMAIDENGKGVIYREVYQPELIVSRAARILRPMMAETGNVMHAPHDLWGRSADSGKSQAERFIEEGINLHRIKARGRVDGWLDIKEWLSPCDDKGTPALVIMKNCTNLIRTLPLLQRSKNDPNDCSTTPHEITHAPDALRYLLAGRPAPAAVDHQYAAHPFAGMSRRSSPIGYGDKVMVV